MIFNVEFALFCEYFVDIKALNKMENKVRKEQ